MATAFITFEIRIIVIMKTTIDLATWPRREHFEFFKQYDMPFFGVTAQLDCTRLYDKAKKEGFPFSAGYHFASLQLRTCFSRATFSKIIARSDTICQGKLHSKIILV